MKVTVIGGGASGMTAALTAARQGNQVCLLERQPRLGKKLLVTGNGRCNLSNRNLNEKNYHGQDTAFAMAVINAFNGEATLRFFHELGLLTVAEADGRLYPLTNQAGSVADVLRLAVGEAGVDVKTDFDVVSIQKTKQGFLLTSARGDTLKSDKAVICCGGMAGAKAGGAPGGYALLESLGHRVSRLYPALVQIVTDPAYVRALKGVRAEGRLTIARGGSVLGKSRGEIQFTEFGLSGPAAFEVSRAVSVTPGELTAHIDLLQALSREAVEDLLRSRRQAFAGLSLDSLLIGILHNSLGRTLLRYALCALNAPISGLTEKDISRIAAACKDFALPVKGVKGFEGAQVTAGGALTADFDPATLQSRLVPGLYAAGEVLDVDGDCGGYNLQWAWASGHLAGLTLS